MVAPNFFALPNPTQISDLQPINYGTITEHHGVGFSTGEITPSYFICENSSWTLCCKGSATLLGVNKANDLASGFSWMLWLLPWKAPKPVKREGYLSLMVVEMASTFVKTFSARIAGRPSRL